MLRKILSIIKLVFSGSLFSFKLNTLRVYPIANLLIISGCILILMPA